MPGEDLNTPPQDWEQKTLGKLGEIVSGGTPSRDTPSFWDGQVPWVTPGEITKQQSKFINATKENISQLGLTASAAILMPNNSILVTTRATIGEVVINTVPMTTNQGFKNIIPLSQVDTKFTYYLIKSITPELIRRASGSTFLEISKREFESVQVNLPPLPEQRRIAEVLDTLDTVIERTEALVHKLKLARAGLLHDLLTRGLDEQGQLRDPERNPEQFKDSELGRVPVGWTLTVLESVAEVSAGVTLGKNLQGAGTIELPYLRVANVQDGHIDLSDIKTVRVMATDVERFTVRDGDVLMNEGGDLDKLGRGAVWRHSTATFLHQNHVFKVRSNTALLVPEYLAFLAASPLGKRYFMSIGKQTTNLASINSTQLRKFPVPLPPLAEQQAMVTSISGMDKALVVEQLQLDKLRQLKRGLMEDLLTGRVRVNVQTQEETSY